MAAAAILQPATDTGPVLVSGCINFETVLNYRQIGEKMIRSSVGPNLTFDLSNADIGGNIGVSLLLCWLRCGNNLGKQVTFSQIPKNLCEMIRVSGVEKILSYE
ncbi:MAG: STAS domain-containing protein [Pseudomonadales bacterium]|nr:STAS domain-containing protein [Pseudomonadales bacterium]